MPAVMCWGRRLGAAIVLALLALGTGATPGEAAILGPLSWERAVHVDVSTPSPDGDFGIVSVSCPSPRLCVAGASFGNVVTSTDPGGGARAWKVMHIADPKPECAAVGCTASLGAVSCAATTCAALDDTGRVLTTANPLVAPWRATTLTGPRGLGAVSCPSASLCVVAGDDTVFSTTNPAADMPVWKAAKLDLGACPTSCSTATPRLTALSCPSVSLCVAGDNAGHVVTSSQPTGDASAWRVSYVDATVVPCAIGGRCQATIGQISCPTTSFCAAADGVGNIFTSQQPAGDASAWTARPVVATYTTGLSCPSSARCVVVDSSDALTSDTPLRNTNWRSRTIDRGGQLNDVSCPSVRLCVAVDRDANIFIARAELLTRKRLQRRLADSLAASHHRAAKISTLLRDGGTTVDFLAPTAGRVLIRWRLVDARRGQRTSPLVAYGRRGFSAAGRTAITLHLTRGASLLKRSAAARLQALVTITPPAEATVTATRKLTLTR